MNTPETGSDSLPLGKRMLATIMFTDVVGYSKMANDDEEKALRLLSQDLSIIRATCERYEGNVLKNTGDGLMVVFTSAVQAVECALEIQRQFAERRQKTSNDERLEHRIGLHLGDVYLQENEVLGDGVNIASRLQGEADEGGICISQALYEVVRTRLELKTVYLGARELKNIPEAVQVHQISVGAGKRRLPSKNIKKISGLGFSLLKWAALCAFTAVLVVAIIVWRPWRSNRSARQNNPSIETQNETSRTSRQNRQDRQNANPGDRISGYPMPGSAENAGVSREAASAAFRNRVEEYQAKWDELQKKRDYAGLVKMLENAVMSRAFPNYEKELEKYKKLAALQEWTARQLEPYSRNQAFQLEIGQKAGSLVWTDGDLGVRVAPPDNPDNPISMRDAPAETEAYTMFSLLQRERQDAAPETRKKLAELFNHLQIFMVENEITPPRLENQQHTTSPRKTPPQNLRDRQRPDSQDSTGKTPRRTPLRERPRLDR
ncbi:MAG: adenylate/guanylate cyclase domain-containing protein [Candidatus Sumerlaeia bacterium]